MKGEEGQGMVKNVETGIEKMVWKKMIKRTQKSKRERIGEV